VAIYEVATGRRLAEPVRGRPGKASFTDVMKARGEKPATDAR
jgi:hypothetical protein